MKMQGVCGIRAMINAGCVLALGASLFLGVVTPRAAGQAPPDDFDCLCLGGCPAVPPLEDITNLHDKEADLVLCASDANPDRCKAIWANNNPQMVATVQDAIVKIKQAYDANSPAVPLNVVVHGHGSSGVQCFGPSVVVGTEPCGAFPVCNGGTCPAGQSCVPVDTNADQTPDACRCATTECIGNSDPAYLANKIRFVKGDETKEGARGKIKDLTLLGCSTAADPKGQGFLEKLKGELDANSIKGFTGTNWFGGPWSFTATTCGTFPECNGTCPAGQVCAQTDTNNDQTLDACRCWQRTLKAGGYQTEGIKKTLIPTVSEWGLVVMAMLVLTAATVVIMRRRAMVRG